jgi:RNA-directed DNA polymerase
MLGSYLHGSWEISSVPDGILSGGAEKGNRNSAIYAVEKSDTPIVSKKPTNNDRPAE